MKAGSNGRPARAVRQPVVPAAPQALYGTMARDGAMPERLDTELQSLSNAHLPLSDERTTSFPPFCKMNREPIHFWFHIFLSSL
jgi:hypothetical protein